MKKKLCVTIIGLILFVVLTGCSSKTVFIEYPVSSSQSLDSQLTTMTVAELTQNMDFYYQQSLNNYTGYDVRERDASYAIIFQNELDMRIIEAGK
jgi:hypothetical protein